jgi:hypothetical protein
MLQCNSIFWTASARVPKRTCNPVHQIWPDPGETAGTVLCVRGSGGTSGQESRKGHVNESHVDRCLVMFGPCIRSCDHTHAQAHTEAGEISQATGKAHGGPELAAIFVLLGAERQDKTDSVVDTSSFRTKRKW